jgi:hypothetical protein
MMRWTRDEVNPIGAAEERRRAGMAPRETMGSDGEPTMLGRREFLRVALGG